MKIHSLNTISNYLDEPKYTYICTYVQCYKSSPTSFQNLRWILPNNLSEERLDFQHCKYEMIHFFAFQLFTSVHILLIITNFTILNMSLFGILLSMPFSSTLSYVYVYVRISVGFFLIFVIIESISIRYLQRFVWKAVIVINDNFIMSCLKWFNILATIICAYVRLNFGSHLTAFGISGIIDVPLNRGPFQIS